MKIRMKEIKDIFSAMIESNAMVETIKKDFHIGPKAICSGTILPCNLGGVFDHGVGKYKHPCKHFGIHMCSTFKKHRKKACPHHPNHDFRCIKIKVKDE